MKIIIIIELIFSFLFSVNKSPVNIEPSLYGISSQAMYFASVEYEDDHYINCEIFEKYFSECLDKELSSLNAEVSNIQYKYYYKNDYPEKVKITVNYVNNGKDYQSILIMKVI